MRNVIFYIVLLFAGLVAVGVCTSCSTTKKNKQSHKSAYDSSATVNKDYSTTTEDKSKTEEKKDYEKVTDFSIDFKYSKIDTGKVEIHTVYLPTGNERLAQQLLRELMNKNPSEVNVKGTVKEKDQGQTKTENNIKSENKGSEDQKSEVKKSEETKSLQVTRKGFSIWVYVGGGVVLLLLIAYLYYRYSVFGRVQSVAKKILK